MQDEKPLIKQQFLEGLTIFSEGDEADRAYLIEKGQITIKKGEKEVAVLGQGDIFGEMAMITKTNHSSTAIATQKTDLVIITKKGLEKKLEEADPLISALIHMFIKRIYKSNEAKQAENSA